MSRHARLMYQRILVPVDGSPTASAGLDQAIRLAALTGATVIGTHGRRGAERFFMGSDAEQIARATPVPVLLVRAKGESGAANASDSRASRASPPAA